MIKFFEIPFEGEDPSIYIVTGNTVALLWGGALVPTLMTLGNLEEGLRFGRVIAHA